VIANQAAVPLVYVPLEAVASKWYGADGLLGLCLLLYPFLCPVPTYALSLPYTYKQAVVAAANQ